jgi:chromosome segregation ATPase
VRLPGLGGLRRLKQLKQRAGRRLRAALVPELDGLTTVLSATREDLERLRQSIEDARATLHQDLSDAEGKIQHLEDLHYELDRRVERIEERRDDLDDLRQLASRVDDLEGLELEDVSELPDRVSELSDRLEAFEDLRAGLRALLRD